MTIMRRAKGIARHAVATVRSKINPIGYARSLGVAIGEDVHFYGMKPGMFSTEPWLVRIGSHVHITSGCQFVTHDGGTLVLRQREPTLELTAPIVVGDRVYIGMNTTVLPGVTIGDDVIIGTGSVVTKDIPSGSVAAGVPARVIKTTEAYLRSAQERSLKMGHLSAKDKEAALKAHFADFIAGQNVRG